MTITTADDFLNTYRTGIAVALGVTAVFLEIVISDFTHLIRVNSLTYYN